MKNSVELWEYKNKEILVMLYKKMISELSNDVYQYGTYSKFVKFVYSTYY